MSNMKTQIVKTNEKLIMRDDKLSEMLTKTDELSDLSSTLNTKSTKLKRKLWWSAQWVKIAMFFTCLVLLYGVLYFACGGYDLKKCR